MKLLGRALAFAAALAALSAQTPPKRPELSGPEKAISERLGHLRQLPDDQWVKETGALAREIQALPMGPGKQSLLGGLSGLVTEGDAGRDTLQVVADTMAQVAGSLPPNQRAGLCGTLARLARYEHVKVSFDDPAYAAAMTKLEEADRAILKPDFTLADLQGRTWSLKDLRGKVVLVNFWATWCPPCRREMPDMQAFYERYGGQGLVILAISDETMEKVAPFIAAQKYTFPVLLDPGRAVNKAFHIEGIPKTFVYGRDGKLAAQAIDRRTAGQMQEMLKQAGLE